jgi:hypothetical protein
VRRSPAAAPQAGDLLLAPVILLALTTLVVNDHVLKGIGPAPLTGILSGIAGSVLMPAVLVAGVELFTSLRGRWMAPSIAPMLAACLAVGMAYAAVELVPAATELYRWTWGMLQWPGAAVLALAGGHPAPGLVPAQAVADPFDLLAMPFLAIPVILQARRSSVSSTGSASA